MDSNNENQKVSTSAALDDEQRVKVLSPGMLVFKRFVRNKLAITGTGILVVMFLFSFLGGLLMPYKQSDVFRDYELTYKEYASAAFSDDYRFTSIDGSTLSSSVRNSFNVAAAKNDEIFMVNDDLYMIEKLGSDLYIIDSTSLLCTVSNIRGKFTAYPAEGNILPEGVADALSEALDSGSKTFILDGKRYAFAASERREYSVFTGEPYSVATKMVFNVPEYAPELSYNFVLNALLTYQDATDVTFEADGKTYTMDESNMGAEIVEKDGVLAAVLTKLAIKEHQTGEVLTLDFKAAVNDAIAGEAAEFELQLSDGEVGHYTVEKKNQLWLIRTEMPTYLIQIYGAPSMQHWLGTDSNGMDIVTRLMYGGRISLTIGFVVVLIEVVIGVILGGLAGYFGKWVDNLIMRLVDVFNCIPTFPLYIILGAAMDQMKVEPSMRIYYLMLILGLVGWPGIARMVRGQILSLREQEFMVATEATGISIPRRIFRHLVPNVIPQLIVISTMTLGGVILTEATLSFLGLGVRYPLASWGNIITAVNDPYVMMKYLFVWVPAGMLILITVLGFNFVGDGLRDAFDPKMKR